MIRCKDCFGIDLLCGDCMVKAHTDNPLHIVEVCKLLFFLTFINCFLLKEWTGNFFKRTTLKTLGLRVQLGHVGKKQCGGRRPAHTDFVVLHTNGIHNVGLDYCLCQSTEEVGDYWQQLMRRKWFPGSVLEPRTACTFEVLELFHRLTLQGKMSLYDFYAGLEKRTDNTGTLKLKVDIMSVTKCSMSLILF